MWCKFAMLDTNLCNEEAGWLSAKAVFRLARKVCPITAPERSDTGQSLRAVHHDYVGV